MKTVCITVTPEERERMNRVVRTPSDSDVVCTEFSDEEYEFIVRVAGEVNETVEEFVAKSTRMFLFFLLAEYN